jgi:hypothetical protein
VVFKVIGAIILSVVATLSLFFIIYVMAYFVATGAIITGKKIKDKFNEIFDKERGSD